MISPLRWPNSGRRRPSTRRAARPSGARLEGDPHRATVRDPNVLITGHPFVDVWAGIRPKVLGLDEWPDVPKGDVSWKEGMCAALGVPFDGFWPRLRNRVNTFADLRPELVGAVEQLIDFVALQPEQAGVVACDVSRTANGWRRAAEDRPQDAASVSRR